LVENLPPVSLADQFRALTAEERQRRLSLLSDAEAQALYYDWKFWARPAQLTPAGEWYAWLVMAGRGFGKTRVGAETVREWVRDFAIVNLIGPTVDDARDVMIEGESGILAICPPDERPEYKKSSRQLAWPNGAKSLIFTADEPERLRGKQHEKLWCDEVGAWRYQESWDQAMFGLRLGARPQAVVTTTPKPLQLIRDLIKDKSTFITRGSTYENRANLAPAFFAKIITKYEGTRLGRQELNAELLADNPGALWQRSQIDKCRVVRLPLDVERSVYALDPATTSTEESDEWGIIGAARDKQNPPHFYIFDDRSEILTPDAACKRAVAGYHLNKSDRIVGEANNGGDMIEALLRHVDLNVSYRKVTASRGKVVRAEPIAALYEQGRVHHVGMFAALEDQMCDYNPATVQKSPDRMDAAVWALTELSEGMYTLGVLEYAKQGGPDAETGAAAKANGAKPPDPRGSVPITAPESSGKVCPACGSGLINPIAGGQLRCNACAHQFGDAVVAVPAGPGRANGNAGHGANGHGALSPASGRKFGDPR
jgi:phage terminase large subunit-like protein